MGVTFLRAPRTTDVDATTWAAAVVTNGGTVSAARLVTVAMFVQAEKAAGTWALTDDYWGLWAENEPQALTSLKQRRLATAVAAPAFVADRGYTGNGTTSYLNSGFIPSTHKVVMATTSVRLAVYERNLLTVSSAAIGVSQTSNLAIYPRDTASKMQGHALTATITTTATLASNVGYTAISGVAGPSQSFWKNGVLFESFAIAMSGSLPIGAIFICCRNVSGAANGFRTSQIGFACIGAALGAPLEAAQYANVQAWATAVGANV